MENQFLKRLELQGFKSFAFKTILEFSHPIVAIVGPNGSGKSNIVDAFRWVLGEREAKELRGEKLENLIFAGTAKKPPAAFARVSLTVNNNFSLKDRGAEIVLTRKIDRSGFSQFFLNNNEVRLKDILLILAKAKLGTRGLTIISQGESDIFVRAKPSERKEMIEEILGLKEFRLKKIQAERQLNLSQINLEKARLSLEELMPHLRFLKKQKKRWEKRQEIEEELKTLENQFFAFSQFQIKKSLKEIEKPLQELEIESAKKNAEIQSRRSRLEHLKNENQKNLFEKTRLEINELLERRSFLEKKLAKMEAQKEMEKIKSEEAYKISINASLIKDLINDFKEMLQWHNLEKIKNALSEWLKKLEKISLSFNLKEKTQNQTPNDFFLKDYEKMKKELNQLEEELKKKKIEEEKIIAEERKANEEFRNLMEEIEEKKNEFQKIENEKQKLIFEKEKLNLQLKELKHQFETLNRSPEEFEKLKWDKENTVFNSEEVEKRLFKLRAEIAAIGEIDAELIKEAQESETRYESLTSQIADLEKASKDLKTMIKDLEKKISSEFEESFRLINEKFNQYFQMMFNGGRARLKLIKEKKEEATLLEINNSLTQKPIEKISEEQEMKDLNSGIEIELSLPKHKNFNLEALSGGERSLLSIVALFALINISPPPFLILDEIDANLDEVNAQRFSQLIKEFSKKTQFVLITHNRQTMEAAGILYGVTLDKETGSKILSLKLKEAEAVGKNDY